MSILTRKTADAERQSAVYPRAPRYTLGARSLDSAMKRTIGVIDPEITCSNCLFASARPKPGSTSDPRKP